MKTTCIASADRPPEVFPRVTIVAAALGVGLLVFTLGASATTFRCEVDGRVTYSDKPCLAGRQATVETADPVGSADRDAAAERRRRDQAQLTQFDRDHARERQEDLRALAAAKKRDADVAKRTTACSKLARRARNAHDDSTVASPGDQTKARLKMQHADEDYAALCKH